MADLMQLGQARTSFSLESSSPQEKQVHVTPKAVQKIREGAKVAPNAPKT